ncbi:MAG: LamG domain-containing protein, partial [Planctomycetes bacterium]|nr:LamG domain-containing protein [Planctomycetota bacterium]
LETVYYWTVQATHASKGPWPAEDVFGFVTNNYEQLEGFEDVNAVEDYWVAGGGETKISTGTYDQGGEQSMKIEYVDSSAPAAIGTLGIGPRDFSPAGGGGRVAMRIGYHGLETNDPAEEWMYVRLTGSSGSVANAYWMEDITEYSWLAWDNINIDLADFTGAGLDAVTEIAVGIGDGSGGESGTLYIDNIRLYASRCVTSEVDGFFIGGDCYADEPNELLALSEHWLAEEVTVTGASDPGTDGLLLHFAFDETEGDFISTTSIGTTTAFLERGSNLSYSQATEVPGSVSSIYVTRSERIVIEDPNLAGADGAVTVSLWVMGDEITNQINDKGKLPVQEPFRFRIGGSNYWQIYATGNSGNPRKTGGGNTVSWNGENTIPDDWQLAWHHIAVIHDSSTNFEALYLDGVKRAHDGYWLTDNIILDPFAGGDITEIRVPHNNRFDGFIDELRVYDRALSQQEILFLANETEVTQPVVGTGPDTNDDGNFDYEDLADLAEVWYLEKLFP